MAENKATKSETATAEPVTYEGLKAVIEAVQATAPIRKVPYSKYKPVSPFNPRGIRNRKMKRVAYQNDHRINVKLLKDAEIDALDSVKPGLYLNGMVRVEVRQGENGEPDQVRLYYKNKTHDQRMILAQELGKRGFLGLISDPVMPAAAAV